MTTKKPAPAKKGAKQDPPWLAKKEEAQHKDLDHDGEKGEPKAHQRKVLGYSKADQISRGKGKGKESPKKKEK